MSKGKSPRTPREKTELVPQEPAPRADLVPREQPQPPQRSPVSHLVEAVRLAVGAVLDLADAAAEAIKNRLEGRA